MLSTTTKRLLLPLTAGLTLAAGAHADEVSFSDSIPLTTTEWVDTVTLGKFDPNLGVLLGIEVSASAALVATLQFESQDAQSSTITITLDVDVELFRQDGVTPLVSAPLQAMAADTVAADDGVLDFGGPAGRTFANLMDSNTVMYANTPPTAQDIADFVGAGPGETVVLPARAGGTCITTGSANVVTLCANDAGVDVTVTYFFGADCNDNGIPDEDDIKNGTSEDCNGNGVPDECEPDCDNDGTPDDCEPDCDNDGVPDDCDDDPCPDCIDVARRTPASLLVYPEFNNRAGELSIVSITNVNTNQDVRVHFIYIGRFGPKSQDLNCLEFDRYEDLTPNDTLSVFTSNHNPQQEQGFVYAYAVDEMGNAIAFDYLIGQLMVVNGIESFQYAVNPIDFRAGEGLAKGDLTDLDNDQVRDLNGSEYEETAAEILIPRFLGQAGQRSLQGEMIWLTFSGGAQFTTSASLLIYNDNEEAFSAQHTFRCWDKVLATEVSQAFRNDFLLNQTAQDDDESVGGLEYGWVRINGKIASSTFYDIIDPAVYAVWIEIIPGWSAADLPWELCTQDGHLFPRGLSGDNEE